MLTTFILIVHSLLALALVIVILMQKSEGGGFTGGSASGNLVSARGVGDMLTRMTAILATLFIITSLTLAWRASHGSERRSIDTSLARQVPAETVPVAPAAPAGIDTSPADTAPAPAAATDNVPVAN